MTKLDAPTMRSIAGAPVTTALHAATAALIVIDFQLEYFSGRLPIPDGMAALRNAQRLMALADAHQMPLFHVQHLGPAGGPLFADDGPLAAIHPEIRPAPHHRLLQKTTTSTFASTDLHQQLQARDIKTLLICGLMTHMCVSTMARDAKPRGYHSIVAADACATRDIAGWDGVLVGHANLHRAALTALSDSFADVLPTAEILQLTVKA